MGAAFLAVTVITVAVAKPDQRRIANITIREVSAIKTIALAEKFIANYKLPSSKQTIETMRLQGEQVPDSAIGSVGRLWTTLFLNDVEAVAHVYFYHAKDGNILSIIIHIEQDNNP